MSDIVSNQIAFIAIKLIGTVVIIFMMKNIISKSEKYGNIGMRIIVFMMVFVVANNLMVITVNALPFNNFSTATGSIGNGNGFFDNETGFTNTVANMNVYLVIEPTMISIVEPVGYAQGSSSSAQLVSKGDSVFQDALVASDGYLYFTDGQGLKKVKTRSSTATRVANDTGIGGTVLLIFSSASIGAIYEYNGAIYFIDGTTLKSVSAPDYQVTTVMTGITKGQDFAIVLKSNVFTVLVSASELLTNGAPGDCSGGQQCVFITMYTSNSSVKNNVTYRVYNTNALVAGATIDYAYSTIITTDNYIYLNMAISATKVATTRTIAHETTLLRSNYSVYYTDHYISPILTASRAVSVGGYSTIALYSFSSTVYDTFNFAEAGILSVAVTPSELIYETSTINSLHATYYNQSNIEINYNIIINQLSQSNIFIDLSVYRWQIYFVDPNGVEQGGYQTGACNMPLLSTTCSLSDTLVYAYPSNGWLAGTWVIRLYEINTVVYHKALIATSPTFTVLNTSLSNQSQVSNPTTPITSGTAPQAISLIDGFVSWLGMGVNSVSKLLFAMILIGIAATIGLIYGNGNVAMVFAFVPYAFFTFIDYIPKWIFIITIILMAIVSKAFR